MAAQGSAKEKRRAPGRGYDGELASSILLEDGEGAGGDGGADLRQPMYHYGLQAPFAGEQSPFFAGNAGESGEAYAAQAALGQAPSGSFGSSPSPVNSSRGNLDFGRRANGEDAPFQLGGSGRAPNRTPTRTPSPVYQYTQPKKVAIGEDAGTSVGGGLGAVGSGLSSGGLGAADADKSSSSTSRGLGGGDSQVFGGMPFFASVLQSIFSWGHEPSAGAGLLRVDDGWYGWRLWKSSGGDPTTGSRHGDVRVFAD